MAGIGIDTSSVEQAVSNITNSKNSTLDKDAFLKLLVTQMQYQDPLEPTSNTEYMAQLAQFSTVEQLENLCATFNANQALNMAGQYVILNVPDSAGKINQVSGLVDYVTMSEGKAYFHINDQYYPADYLDSIVSIDYLEHLIKNPGNEENGGENSGENGGENSGENGEDKGEGEGGNEDDK